MGYKSKYKGSEIDSLLDKAKNDYTVKEYADYAGYNADTSRPSNTISLIQQDQSVVVGGKRYSQNAECYVGSDASGISTTGNWFLAGEATITNARDVNVVGIVQHAITSGTCGIFALGLRGYSEAASKFNFSWLCKTGGTVPLLRVVINGFTVKLYCKVYGGQYQYAHIRLLDQCNQYEANNYKTSFFTLKDSTTIIPEVDVPSGTDIADVPYLLKDGTAASAISANKLATPRSFNLGGGLTGTAVNFDGTGNVELKGGLKKVFSVNGNVHNYQYHRFLSIGSAKTPLPATSQNYHFTFLVQNSETGSREGLLDINLRTNGTPQNSYLVCRWLLLSSYSSGAHPKIAYGFSDNATTSYVDLFIVHAENYKNYHFVLLSFNRREVLNVTSDTNYTLYNSAEFNNTTATDKLTSYEVYTSIAQAGQEIHGHTTDAGYSIVKDDTIANNMATSVNGFVNSATNADVANKTKYPIVFKRNGASITNWFANTTFVIDIPEELLDYSAPTGITLKVPEISVANKVANKLSLTVNGSTTEYDGSAGARVSIKANCTHIVKANSNSSLGTIYPEQTGHPSSVTVPISILPLEPYNSAARGLNDGDTLILHIPNSMSNPTANYVWCVKLDITKENATDNIIPLIHGQSAGTPAYWNTSTTMPAGFYQFVYSATLGGLVYMYGNTSTT